MKKVHVIGGGLAGPEAALQAAALGCKVVLSEMRPLRSTEAHQTGDFAELVCSNSLKSESENSAPWLLKQEMRRAGSFLLGACGTCAGCGSQRVLAAGCGDDRGESEHYGAA